MARFLIVSSMGTADVEHADPMRAYLRGQARRRRRRCGRAGWTGRSCAPAGSRTSPGRADRGPRAGARPLRRHHRATTSRSCSTTACSPTTRSAPSSTCSAAPSRPKWPSPRSVRSVSVLSMQHLLLAGLLLLPPRPSSRPPPRRHGQARAPPEPTFYTPPKALPAGPHGTPIWQRKLTGKVGAQEREEQHAAAVPIDLGGRQDGRVSGTVALPKGKAPKARLARDHVGARHGRDRRRLRAVARRGAGQLRQPAAQRLGEGGLRRRTHRLRRPRHAR